MIDLEIYNSDLIPVGVVDNFASLIWHRKYFTNGIFEIYAPFTSGNCEMLRTNYFVTKLDAVECGIITAINISQDDDGAEFITASGKFLSGLLIDRKIIYNTPISGTVESSMRKLVKENCIATSADRILPGLELGELKGFTFSYSTICEYGELLECLFSLAKISGLGFRIKLGGVKLKFEVYEGVDRSINQSILPQIIFSKEYDNLLSCAYSKDTTTEVNFCYARATGTNIIVSVGTGAGFNRKEKYVEGEAVTYELDGESIIDVIATRTLLTGLATKELYPPAESFEGSIDFAQGYKTDYDLGDIVTVFNDKWDVQVTNRICEIIEVYDENGTSIIPTFGTT